MHVAWLLLALPAACALATGWSTSAAPTAAQLTAGKEAGEVVLWGSVRPPRARQTAQWELKLFFKADDDMQVRCGHTCGTHRAPHTVCTGTHAAHTARRTRSARTAPHTVCTHRAAHGLHAPRR